LDSKKKRRYTYRKYYFDLGDNAFISSFCFVPFIDRIITPLGWFNHINKAYAFIGLIAYFMSFYFLVYNKKRWESYIEEFGNESEHQRNRGNRSVISYLIGSVSLFFICLPILFFLGKRLYG
jgi:hypothetical protein